MARGDVDALRANVKACNLIKDWLDKDEWDHLVKKHEVVVKSRLFKDKNRYYLIREDASDRVIVIENGKEKETLCGIVIDHDIETRKQLVNGDQLLTKIITLKTDEQHYIDNSNSFRGSGASYNFGRRLRLNLS